LQAPLELLLVALRDDQSSVRSAAARAFSRNPRPAVLPALIATLTDSEWIVRAEVARALGKLSDPEALAGLLVAARDPDAAVRAAALLALGETGASEVVELLNAALQDEDWSVREAATLALAQFTEPVAIPPLLNARLDQDPSVRSAAEAGLQQLYPNITATPPPPSDSFTQWLGRIEMSQAENTPHADQIFALLDSAPDSQSQARFAPISPAENHVDQPASSGLPVKRRKVTRLLTLVEAQDVPAPIPATDETTDLFATSLFAHMQHTAAQPPTRSTWPYRLMRLAEALVAILIFAGLIVTGLMFVNRPDVVPVQQNAPSAFTIYREHIGSVEKLAWSPDGRLMASADNRGMVLIWQVGS
ncbi:MAG: HEAT repeat domain-containing protein, partial [Ktedonobacteraceae bacterium]